MRIGATTVLVHPSLTHRARWRLANRLWPQRHPHALATAWRRRACEAEALLRWKDLGGETSGRPRPEARSQTGEDALLWDLLGDRESGFFVEAGAYDGYSLSVSYLFEGAGWSGVLVEPLSDRAEECRRRRPRSRVVTAALSRVESASTAGFTRVVGEEMLSYLEPNQAHLDRLEREAATAVTEDTAVLTLDQVLEGHSGTIDFVALDIEGHELAALEGLDLARWAPTALLVEDNSEGRDRRVQRHLEAHDYVYLGSLAHNDVYLSRAELGLAQRLAGFWDDLRTTA